MHAFGDRTEHLFGNRRWKCLTNTIPANLQGILSIKATILEWAKRQYLCCQDHTDPVPGLQKPLQEGALSSLDCRVALVSGVRWQNERVGAMFEHLGQKALGKTICHCLGSFQLQMGFSFPFLRANDLRSSSLNTRTRIFTLLYIGGTYARLVYNWYRNIFHSFAVLIVFCVANEKTGRKED